MSTSEYPAIEYLRQALRYDGGRLFRLERPRDHFATDRQWKTINTRYAGKEAGNINWSVSGGPRWMVGLDYRSYYRHRLVWALLNGEWCEFLDHINRNSLDDRIENIRPATLSQNNANQSIRCDNVSGCKGVSWSSEREKWVAHISVRGKVIHLGRFATIDEARVAYIEAAHKHFGDFACDGRSESTADDVPTDPPSEHLERPVQRTFWE